MAHQNSDSTAYFNFIENLNEILMDYNIRTLGIN